MEQIDSMAARLGMAEMRLVRVEEQLAHITNDNLRLEKALDRVRDEIKEDLNAIVERFVVAIGGFSLRVDKIESRVTQLLFAVIAGLFAVICAVIAVVWVA